MALYMSWWWVVFIIFNLVSIFIIRVVWKFWGISFYTGVSWGRSIWFLGEIFSWSCLNWGLLSECFSRESYSSRERERIRVSSGRVTSMVLRKLRGYFSGINWWSSKENSVVKCYGKLSFFKFDFRFNLINWGENRY